MRPERQFQAKQASATRRIAVIGATGMLGQPVTSALVDAGLRVTALIRNPEQARLVLPTQARIAVADARDEDSLRRGMAGSDGLYLSLAIAPGDRREDFHTEQQGLAHILAAARASGIRRIGYVSALVHDTNDDDWWVIQLWREAIARIKESGIPYTIFYPTNFMETLPQRHMMGTSLVLPGKAHYCNYWIAGRDFGRQVARAFQLPQAANREYAIQGPEPMSYEEAACRYAQALPVPPRIVKVPLALMRLAGHFSRSMDYDARIMQTVLDYYETFKASDAWDELGRPSTTIEEFARLRSDGRQ
jgi:uncharacterized protein YbjT (DUF2867 family)